MTEKQREKWLLQRRSYLGATDISAICGVNPYASPLSVYRDKKGLSLFTGNRFTEWGIIMEPVVARYFAKTTGKTIVKSKTYRMKGKRYFGATPDYEVPGEDALLEIKTASFFAGKEFQAINSDEVPAQYLIQCQWQMFVTGKSFVYLAVLVGGNDFRIYEITRDDALISLCVAKAEEFWQTFMLSDCPPAISAAECDTEILRQEYPQDNGEKLYADDKMDTAAYLLIKKRQELSVVEKEKALYENQIKEFMKSATFLSCGSCDIEWKTNARGARVFKVKENKA